MKLKNKIKKRFNQKEKKMKNGFKKKRFDIIIKFDIADHL